MKREKAILLVAGFFLLGLLVRLPNLGRPVSKHHEFMSALILINAASWRQGGGGSHFNYVPVLNFQNAGDKYYTRSEYVDRNGDRWYLSLGPGWYVLPYFMYEVFHLNTDVSYLRGLNLMIGLGSLCAFFLLMEQLFPGRYPTIITASFLFVFSPAGLWYTGNGYSHTAIQLPLLLWWFWLLLPALTAQERIRPLRLAALFFLPFILVYLDWLILFMIGGAAAVMLFGQKKEKKSILPLLVSSAGVLMGLLLIFFQFASYGGAEGVLAYWKSRFLFRSIANQPQSFPEMLSHLLFFHAMTSFLPLVLLLIAGLVRAAVLKTRILFTREQRLFLLIYSTATVLYNLVFLEWSYEHEFSLVPWMPVLAILAAIFIEPLLRSPRTIIIGTVYLAITLSQYYFINRPGKISRDGMAYDRFRKSGELIRLVPPDYKIYSSIEKPAPMIEYYAGRNITGVANYEEAEQDMEANGIRHGVWVDQKDYQLGSIRLIR
jgi:hypothetical protein